MRGEAESADRGDESGDCGSAAADGFGRGRWKPAGWEERQADKEGDVEKTPPWVLIIRTHGGNLR